MSMRIMWNTLSATRKPKRRRTILGNWKAESWTERNGKIKSNNNEWITKNKTKTKTSCKQTKLSICRVFFSTLWHAWIKTNITQTKNETRTLLLENALRCVYKYMHTTRLRSLMNSDSEPISTSIHYTLAWPFLQHCWAEKVLFSCN